MNPLVLVIAAAAAWLLRRSVAARVERASLLSLPVGDDGVIAGAQAIERRGAGRRAVLILHGFGDTPQTVGYLADHLHGLGFAVRAPLLAGHGRTLREFSRSGADSWLDTAARELAALRDEYDSVGVVGVSMGGALAVILAADPEQRPADALVLIAPYLSMSAPARRLSAMHRVLAPFVHYVPSREEASIRDAAERKLNLGFGTVTPRLLNELQHLVTRARRSLPAVTAPTLVIQSRGDNRIDATAAAQCFERLGAAEKRFEWTEGGGHVITVDVGRERVFTLTSDWLLARVGGGASSSTHMS